MVYHRTRRHPSEIPRRSRRSLGPATGKGDRCESNWEDVDGLREDVDGRQVVVLPMPSSMNHALLTINSTV
jgi:hypothetical protein